MAGKNQGGNGSDKSTIEIKPSNYPKTMEGAQEFSRDMMQRLSIGKDENKGNENQYPDISDKDFEKLVELAATKDTGGTPPSIEDRRERFEAAEKISLNGWPCKAPSCEGILNESGKCDQCGMVIKSLLEL